MRYYKLFSLGFIVALLSSCGTLPERVESDDIQSWCQEEEEDVSLIPYLIPGISTIVPIRPSAHFVPSETTTVQ
jgi:hypothetical protein